MTVTPDLIVEQQHRDRLASASAARNGRYHVGYGFVDHVATPTKETDGY